MQPWEFLVMKKPELKGKIVDLIGDIRQLTRNMEQTREQWMGEPWRMTGLTEKNMDYTTAPVYILLLGDPRTNVGLPMFIRYDESSRQMIYYSSLANAFMYMHLAATTLGIGTQWVSITHAGYVQSMIKQLLKISDELEGFDMVALGYPEMLKALADKVYKLRTENYENYGHVDLDKKRLKACYGCINGCDRQEFPDETGRKHKHFCQASAVYIEHAIKYNGLEKGLEVNREANRLSDQYGLDTAVLMPLIDWLSSCFNAGILTEEETGLSLSKIGSIEAKDFSTFKGKALAAKNIQDYGYMKESLVICDLAWPIYPARYEIDGIGFSTIESRILSAITGKDINVCRFWTRY